MFGANNGAFAFLNPYPPQAPRLVLNGQYFVQEGQAYFTNGLSPPLPTRMLAPPPRAAVASGGNQNSNPQTAESDGSPPHKAKKIAQKTESAPENGENKSSSVWSNSRPLVKIPLTGKETAAGNNKSINGLQNMIAKLQNLNAEQEKLHLEEKERINDEQNLAKLDFEACEAQKNQLEHEVDDLRSKLAIAVEAIEEENRKRGDEGRNLSSLVASILAKKDDKCNCKLMIEALKSELEESNEKLKGLNEEREKQEKLENWNSTLQSVVASKSKTIENLQNELAKRQEAVYKKDEENSKLIMECKELKEEAEKNTAQKELKKTKEEVKERENASLIEKNKKIKNELKSLQKKRDADRRKTKDLEKTRGQLRRSKEEEKRMRNQMNFMNKSIERKSVKLRTLEKELKMAREKWEKRQTFSKSRSEVKCEFRAKLKPKETGVQTDADSEVVLNFQVEIESLERKLVDSEHLFFNALHDKDEMLAALKEQLALAQQGEREQESLFARA